MKDNGDSRNSTASINTILTIISIILIILGLFLILSGVRQLLINNSSDSLLNLSDNTDGRINIGISTTKSPEITPTIVSDKNNTTSDSATVTAKIKAEENKKRMSETGRWITTDYQSGDIVVGKYIVQSGDTLWEIAEAVYGSGFEWQKILARNKSQIGYLPNGSQALIIPGQILVIP